MERSANRSAGDDRNRFYLDENCRRRRNARLEGDSVGGGRRRRRGREPVKSARPLRLKKGTRKTVRRALERVGERFFCVAPSRQTQTVKSVGTIAAFGALGAFKTFEAFGALGLFKMFEAFGAAGTAGWVEEVGKVGAFAKVGASALLLTRRGAKARRSSPGSRLDSGRRVRSADG